MFYLVAIAVFQVASSEISTSWWNSMQFTADILQSMGSTHVRDHFPTSSLLTEAIHHQLEILSIRSQQSPSNSIGADQPLKVNNVRHPFISCTKYMHYNTTITHLADSIGDSFQPHITLASAVNDKVCFMTFVENTEVLNIFLGSHHEKALSLFVPVPDVLKLDHSVLHTIDWTVDHYSQSAKNLRLERSEERLAHPILKDVIAGATVELSIIFRSGWTSLSQQSSVISWLETLQSSTSSNRRSLEEKSRHWDDFVWTHRSGDHSERGSYVVDGHVRSSSSIRRRRALQSSHYFSMFEHADNLPPYHERSNRSPDLFESSRAAEPVDAASTRQKWSLLRDTYTELLRNNHYNGGGGNDVCNYRRLKVTHRSKNVIISLGSDFFESPESAGACFSNLVVLLSSDPGVSRVALSRPMRTLNSNARPIMQTGSRNSEVYSDAGLDGTGVIVGISDTGIDELSCFFHDPKGRVKRSSAEHPIADLSFRYPLRPLFIPSSILSTTLSSAPLLRHTISMLSNYLNNLN
jgi:hypothetical protein